MEIRKKSEFSMRNKTANLWNWMVTVAEAISKSVLSLFFPQAGDKDLRQRSCIPLILAVCRRLVAYELSNSLVCVCVCQSSKFLICFFTLQGLAERAGIL